MRPKRLLLMVFCVAPLPPCRCAMMQAMMQKIMAIPPAVAHTGMTHDGSGLEFLGGGEGGDGGGDGGVGGLGG